MLGRWDWSINKKRNFTHWAYSGREREREKEEKTMEKKVGDFRDSKMRVIIK